MTPATAPSFNFFGNTDNSAPQVANGSSQPSGRFALPPRSASTPSATPQPSVNGTTAPAPAAATAPANKNHFSFGPHISKKMKAGIPMQVLLVLLCSPDSDLT